MIPQQPATLMSMTEAAKVVAACQQDDPECQYVMEPRGCYYAVQVFDEDGKLLGYL